MICQYFRKERNQHLLSTYYVAGIELSAFLIHSHFVFIFPIAKILSLSYRLEEGSSGKLSDCTRSGKNRIREFKLTSVTCRRNGSRSQCSGSHQTHVTGNVPSPSLFSEYQLGHCTCQLNGFRGARVHEGERPSV
uniref:Uncharacterized protein n=1 Tax=Rousettus aegyptiacus TaxID=9407 RepID=A0A7J8CI75_ROUAE|nr:hypothetical protein HJG63_009016 [Rousettus aegyptiacus]